MLTDFNLSKELDRDLDRMMTSIAALAGGEFNINSPATRDSLVRARQTPAKTKTGYSTDEDTLHATRGAT